MGTDKHQTDGDGTCCTCVDHSYSSGSYEPAAADFPVTTARRGGGPSQWHAGRAFTAAAMPLRFIVIMATFRRADAGTRDPIGSVLYRYEVLSNFSDLKRSRGQLLVCENRSCTASGGTEARMVTGQARRAPCRSSISRPI